MVAAGVSYAELRIPTAAGVAGRVVRLGSPDEASTVAPTVLPLDVDGQVVADLVLPASAHPPNGPDVSLPLVAEAVALALCNETLTTSARRQAVLNDTVALIEGMVFAKAAESDVIAMVGDGLRRMLDASVVLVSLDAAADDGGTAVDDAGGCTCLLSYYDVGRGVVVRSRECPHDVLDRLAQARGFGAVVTGHGPVATTGVLSQIHGPWLVVPIDSDGHSIGVICAVRDEAAAAFTTEDVTRVSNVSSRTAMALRYLRSQEWSDTRLVTHERHRIARDLHDLTIQRLYGVGMMLDTGLRLTDGESVTAGRAAAAIDEINEAIYELRLAIAGFEGEPPPVGGHEVVEAVTEEVTRQALRFREPPQVRTDISADFRCPRPVLRALTAAAREALSNAARHTFEPQVGITLTVDDCEVVLAVVSAGAPRADAGGSREGTGRGVSNLTARARALGGDCTLRVADDGAELRWWVPVAVTSPSAPVPDPAGG